MTADEEKVWNLVHEFCGDQWLPLPDQTKRYLMDKINEYASQQREAGIREGFEAARLPIVEEGRNCGDLYHTVEDYLTKKSE